MSLSHAYFTASQCYGLAAGSITISSGSSTNKTYLVDGRVDKRWDSGAAIVTTDIDLNFGAPISLYGFAVLNHDQIAGSLVTVTGASDAAFSVSVTTPVNARTPRTTNALLQFAASASRQYWRLTFQSISSSRLKIGEIYALGAPTILTRYVTYGHGKAKRFKGTFVESDAGRLFGHNLAGPLVDRKLTWEDLRTTEKDEILAMHAAVKGNASDILFSEIWDPTLASSIENDRQECYLGRFLEPEISPSETDFGIWNGVSLTLREQSRGVGL